MPFFQGDACPAMARAAAACLRKARLAQLAQARGTLASCEGEATREGWATPSALSALHSLTGAIVSAADLPEVMGCRNKHACSCPSNCS